MLFSYILSLLICVMTPGACVAAKKNESAVLSPVPALRLRPKKNTHSLSYITEVNLLKAAIPCIPNPRSNDMSANRSLRHKNWISRRLCAESCTRSQRLSSSSLISFVARTRTATSCTPLTLCISCNEPPGYSGEF